MTKDNGKTDEIIELQESESDEQMQMYTIADSDFLEMIFDYANSELNEGKEE